MGPDGQPVASPQLCPYPGDPCIWRSALLTLHVVLPWSVISDPIFTLSSILGDLGLHFLEWSGKPILKYRHKNNCAKVIKDLDSKYRKLFVDFNGLWIRTQRLCFDVYNNVSAHAVNAVNCSSYLELFCKQLRASWQTTWVKTSTRFLEAPNHAMDLLFG